LIARSDGLVAGVWGNSGRNHLGQVC